MWTGCHVRMQLQLYSICHVIIWWCSLKLLQPRSFQIHMHVRLSNLFSAFYFYNMKPIRMLIFGWGHRGWNRCISTDLFNYAMRFVNHPPNHLSQSFSSLHFVRFLGFSSNLLPYHLLAIGTTSLFDNTSNIFGWSFLFFPMVLTNFFVFHQLQALPLMFQIHLQWRWTCDVLHHTL